MSVQIPDCFCPKEQTCDWDVEAVVTYRRKSDPEDVLTFRAGYEQHDLPQVVAHAIATEIIKEANAKGQEIYATWLEACLTQENPAVTVRKIMGQI